MSLQIPLFVARRKVITRTAKFIVKPTMDIMVIGLVVTNLRKKKSEQAAKPLVTSINTMKFIRSKQVDSDALTRARLNEYTWKG